MIDTADVSKALATSTSPKILTFYIMA